MMSSQASLLGAFALALAAISGYAIAFALMSFRRRSSYRKSVMGISRQKVVGGESGGIDAAVIGIMKKIQLRGKGLFAKKGSRRSGNVDKMLRHSGLEGAVSANTVFETEIRFALFDALAGFVVGFIFSTELALILCACGAIAGWRLPGQTLKRRIRKRRNEAERRLPELLDVMALCMRSGMSIDSSLAIYSRHFDSMLADELECARVKWSSGLERRDESLKKLARTYDSVVFGRVIETIVRSARYGSSMVASLESDAKDARSVYRASREEKIAKAPVKMMIPTGVLILPAMLIMVLGPVLLELMEGGF